jgi:cardiolipin synthase
MPHLPWESIWQIAAAIVFVAGVLLALRAILTARTPQSAIGWALGLIFLPVVSIPLYLIFGQSRFSGYVLSGKGKHAGLDQARNRLFEAMKPFEARIGTRYDDLSHLALGLTGFPPVSGNKLKLLINGQQTFQAIFGAIDRATEFVLVQFYIIHDDKLGKKLAEHLVAARARGIPVFLLYDSVGAKDLPWEYCERLRKAGVEVAPFITNREIGVRFQINFRNHRKVVVIDGHTGFTGGLNIGDEYMGESWKFGPWRDTHVQIRGPMVAPMTLGFFEDWHYATGQIPAIPHAEPKAAGQQRGFYFFSGPADAVEICPALYLEMIRMAQHRLWIASPYFVPDFAVRLALQHAALRGVDVRILLPGMADHKLPYLSSFSFYPAMHRAGVRIFRMKEGFMHQKVLLADDELALVGSVNLDARSFGINFESAMVAVDSSFAADVAKMLEDDFTASREEDLQCYEQGSLGFRLKVRLASLMSPEQ